MSTKGTIKSNDFAQGAASKGQVSAEQKKAKRAALLEQAKQKAQNKADK
ncbi:hypothetical protein JOC36_000602 [Weissella uvarum]|nr:hypothetical protein [Weissella uvarum]MBM7617053.1 hypothetical protein [Weissella uvarum]MCM0595351.1 hypothetical protein [Weissella uvarum]